MKLFEPSPNGISAPSAATIAFVVGVGLGVVVMDVAHEHQEFQMRDACAKPRLAGYTGYALPTAKGYQCLMVPDKAQPWSFSPNIIINK